MEVIRASVYDYPKYYDLLYGSDSKAEQDFLGACFARHAGRPVRRLFEPGCGTGRLIARFAAAGYEIAGNDLRAEAVEYCNARLARLGLPPTGRVGDMADFRPAGKVDGAFNLISTFRHLETEAAAESHLHCMADALADGGVYVLGLHLTPNGRRTCDDEAWTARRGRLALALRMWSIHLDHPRRLQRVGLTVDVHTPRRQFRLAGELLLRTYTAAQFQRLLARVGRFDVAQTYDFGYDVSRPIRVDEETEDVIFVLRRR